MVSAVSTGLTGSDSEKELSPFLTNVVLNGSILEIVN